MNTAKVHKAALEAQRFLAAVHALKARMVKDKDVEVMLSSGGYRETGALRRASMDLSRALSDLRKNN